MSAARLAARHPTRQWIARGLAIALLGMLPTIDDDSFAAAVVGMFPNLQEE